MTPEGRFDLSNMAVHDVAALGAHVRGCGQRGAGFDAIASAVVGTIWNAFGGRTPHALALVQLYRSDRRELRIAAERTLDGAAGSEPTCVVEDLESAPELPRVEIVSDAVAHPKLGELVLRYGIKAAVAVTAPVTANDRFVLAVYSRVAVARGLDDAFAIFALDVALALGAAGEFGDDATRLDNLDRLLSTHDTTLASHVAALAREADAQRRRADELDKRLAKEHTASSDRLQRAQRAMLNVIEDLREARADLESRVASRTAELQRATEEANRASSAKDEFLAMLGHELRNPLAPILTALELMRLRGGDLLLRERTIIERQTSHLATLVDDLLDVSRIARGLVQLKRVNVRLADVIAKAAETAAPLFEQQRHELVVEVPTGFVVDGDPARLAQVFSNLLTNAAKYTDPGGRIVVAARHDGDDIAVGVSDNGRGISAEMLPRVFDLFVQERQNIDRARGGLGLGLAIVRNVVQLHGGRIDAASDGVGWGSTFTVYLPRVASAEIPAIPMSCRGSPAAPGSS